jgi:phage gpG-like protein
LITRIVENRNLIPTLEKINNEAFNTSIDLLHKEIERNLSGPKSKDKLDSKTLRENIVVDKSNKEEKMIGIAVKWAAIHEFGGVVKAKKAKYLKFKIDNMWKTVKSVIIPSRPFMRNSFYTVRDKMGECFRNKG